MVMEVKESRRKTQRKSSVSQWFRFAFSTRDLMLELSAILPTLQGTRNHGSASMGDHLSQLSIWVPGPFLPPLVQALKKGRVVPQHIRTADGTFEGVCFFLLRRAFLFTEAAVWLAAAQCSTRDQKRRSGTSTFRKNEMKHVPESYYQVLRNE
jgi:hypothetical protein